MFNRWSLAWDFSLAKGAMHSSRPIMILTASAGAGHFSAAQAIETALRSAAPAENIELYDMVAHGGFTFRRIYAQGYRDLVRACPSAWAWLYYGTDRPNDRPSERAWDWMRRVLQDASVRRFRNDLIRRQPRLVVNTHFLPPEIVASMRRTGRLTCLQATAITDFEAHRLWIQEPTERYFTATQRAAEYAVACGAQPESIRRTGIPVSSEFEVPIDRRQLRRGLGLEAERPVVLLLGFAGGLATGERLFRQLMEMDPTACVVAITGGYDRLRQRLMRVAAEYSRPSRVLGFTKQMPDWMRAADLAVTKPGGLTVAEALACRLPLVLTCPLAGQELCNNDFMLEHGAAVKVNKTPLLGQCVSSLLRRPDRLEGIRSAMGRLSKRSAARQIAEHLLELLYPDRHLTNPGSAQESPAGPALRVTGS